MKSTIWQRLACLLFGHDPTVDDKVGVRFCRRCETLLKGEKVKS